MTTDLLEAGTVVLHPKRPEWGPGKILEILTGGEVVIYLRDASKEAPGNGAGHPFYDVAVICLTDGR